MKRFAIACVAVLGLMIAGSTAANAGDFRIQIGGFGGRGFYGHGHGGYYGGRGLQHGYGYRAPRIWHDTSHFDYHPGQFVPHRNHFHYQPGHYDFHRTGHWDTLHGNHIHHHGH